MSQSRGGGRRERHTGNSEARDAMKETGLRWQGWDSVTRECGGGLGNTSQLASTRRKAAVPLQLPLLAYSSIGTG